MSDKETARKAAKLIMELWTDGCRTFNEAAIAQIIAVECRAPAPQPEKCGQRFTCAATGLRIYVCALEKGHAGDCDDHPTRGLAATPQVTPKVCPVCYSDNKKRRNLANCVCGQSEDHDIACYCTDSWHEGTSEQAPPTPEKCPTCNSADRSGHIVAWAGLEAVYCADSWHSSAATQKGTTKD